ncbi:sensor histidine kinase [Vallitalea guaymasensis]|uniref:histidine kinase n=1 Tax=Vallitalea guaymasensis TaxID=1185412 RepID=A0A8J8MDD8_9FIRM|nr:histidine kinase [Vallitalea guaymasensis]QUH30886.1 histidine kinase [Vallitalea guaymasensis]
MKFRAKIILSIISITVIISIVTSIIYYKKTAVAIENNYRSTISENITTKVLEFDDIMRKMYYTSVEASCDLELIGLIREQYGGKDRLLAMNILLNKYKMSSDNIDSIYVYLPKNNKVVKSQEYKAVIDIDETKDYQWLSKINDFEQNFSPIYIEDDVGSVNKFLFTYSKPIKDPDTNEIIGEIAFNMDERIVYFSCLDSINSSLNITTEIVNKDNVVVSSELLSKLGKEICLPSEASRHYQRIIAPFTGYSFVSDLNVEALTKDITDVRNYIIIAAVITMLISVCLALIMSNRLYVPVKNLKIAMRKLSEGDLTARATVSGNDEISILSSRFNNMANKMERLIDELVTEKLLKREAELEALQYQITPHFMYNTLNSIKCAAFLQEAYEIVDLLDAFIELLQSTISKKGAFITLEDELNLVSNYVLLQRFRYKDSFTVNYEIEPNVKELFVPRLILQPLVENSIYHGLDTKTDKNRIIIRATRTNDELILSVKDNGKGMTEIEKNNIFKRKKGKKEKFNCIGISNIKDRIKLYYGEYGSISYLSRIGEGTDVMIIIPATKVKEKYMIREDEKS